MGVTVGLAGACGEDSKTQRHIRRALYASTRWGEMITIRRRDDLPGGVPVNVMDCNTHSFENLREVLSPSLFQGGGLLRDAVSCDSVSGLPLAPVRPDATLHSHGHFIHLVLLAAQRGQRALVDDFTSP